MPGSVNLRPESQPALEQIRDLMSSRADVTLLRIEVHTDSDGDDKANEKLSKDRAMQVARALVTLGVDCRRLIPVGFGETRPIAPNDRPELKAKNRRTEFHIAALRNKAVRMQPVDGGGSVAGDPCK
jgi:OOP family OmpA-OmpF porin